MRVGGREVPPRVHLVPEYTWLGLGFGLANPNPNPNLQRGRGRRGGGGGGGGLRLVSQPEQMYGAVVGAHLVRGLGLGLGLGLGCRGRS